MKFKKKETPTGTAWFSGNYKVVRYGKHWFAYWKKPTAKMWGMSCFYGPFGTSMDYTSRTAAQRACAKHLNSEE